MNFLVNAVKLHFNRNWTRKDMMSSAPIPQHARTSLQKTIGVSYSPLCHVGCCLWIPLAFYRGSRGLFTVLSSEASLFWLYHTPPWRVRKRVVLLMYTAFCVSASVGPFTKYFFEINQSHRQINFNGLIQTYILMQLSGFDIHQWTLKAYVLLAFFMGYLVLYSQEILYDARLGEIDFVNGTYAVFLHLAAIVVHAVRLCLGANIEQQRHN